MYLVPDREEIIPACPETEGFDTQRLAVNLHEFPGTDSNRKIAYLFSHASGFHKECFHPLMRRLIDHFRRLKEYDQTDFTFVSWDARTQGDSARLNKGTFTEKYSWMAHACDTKQVIQYFNLKTDYDQLIGVGHSFGSTGMLLLEFHSPKTFDGICSIEPVLFSSIAPLEQYRQIPIILKTSKRREEWPNREECAKSLWSNKFFNTFHPEVLDLYVKYGTYDTEEGTVKLKCPKDQEMWILYSGQYFAYLALRIIPHLTIPTHFVFGSTSTTSEYDINTFHGNSSWITCNVLEGGHMVPNDKPDLIIPEIKTLLGRIDQNKPRPKL